MPIYRAIDPADGAKRRRRDRDGGFTLIEVVLALAILGLLASLGLPFSRPGAGAAVLREKAFEIVALLRTDRNVALRSGSATTVVVDPQTGTVRSSISPARIVLPASMSLRVAPETAQGFRFYPDGRASGGRLQIVSGGRAVVIDVNGRTAAISVVDGSR